MSAPPLEIASRRSPRTSMPTSPCAASTGWRKIAGVPVDEKVEASFRATIPDFPIPVTTTRPEIDPIASTALTNVDPRRPAMDATLSLSMRSTSRPRSMMRDSCARSPMPSLTLFRPPVLETLRNVRFNEGTPFPSRSEEGLAELSNGTRPSTHVANPDRGLLDLGNGIRHGRR